MHKRLAILIAFAGTVLVPSQSHATQQQMCYDLYQPVCAAQPVECFAAPCYPIYKTYSNTCFMQSDNATFIHNGECTAAETGPVKPASTTPSTPPATTTAPYTPPANCTSWFDGCNSCSKNANGAVCTLKACLTVQAGYCTAYAASTTPTTPPPHPTPSKPVATSSPVVHASSTTNVGVSSSPAMPSSSHGIVYQIWHTILSWFGFR